MSVETFDCRWCGARFGIAGENTGTAEDRDADDYYASEVQFHQDGECVSAVRRRWLSLRSTPRRRRGVVLTVRAAAPKPKPATTTRQRRDSTRAKRARRDRAA